MHPRVVVILSITSDFGIALAKRYAQEGYIIIGTYRSTNLLHEVSSLPNCHLFFCDLTQKTSIKQFIEAYQSIALPWDDFVSCPCTPLPLGPFFKCNFDEWSDSIHINAIEQLRVLHSLHRLKKEFSVNNVIFFAGGGVNGAVLNFSGYTISKLMLIKMCELLDAENNDLNIFIVGPGWTRTKTHYLTLEKVDRSDKKYSETLHFLQSKDPGTSLDDVYDCIRWLSSQGKEIASGRNFSVRNDQWKGRLQKELIEELSKDPDMYKLRRAKNNWSEHAQTPQPTN